MPPRHPWKPHPRAGHSTSTRQRGMVSWPWLGVLALALAGGLLVAYPAWANLLVPWVATRWLGASLLGGTALLLGLWQLPHWQVRALPPGPERAALAIHARHTLVHLCGGGLLILTLVVTAPRVATPPAPPQRSQEVSQLAHAGQRSARIAQAMAQLGDRERLSVRLGGIYTLEQLAHDSPTDHGPIMQVLMAYLRDIAPWPPKDMPLQTDETGRLQSVRVPPLRSSATDMQAILTVLGRRTQAHEQGEPPPVDLSYTALAGVSLERAQLQGSMLRGIQLQKASLAGAHLENAHLEESDLTGAHLPGAYLQGAHLTGMQALGANLRGAFLGGANLQGANLQGANLQGAHLPKASVRGADLRGATLWDAELWGVDARGADLRGVKDLAQHQADVLCVDAHTRLPDGLTPPPLCRPL